MSNMRVGAIVQHLRQLMEEDRYRQASDGQLLQGILVLSDPGAFEELIRRHGPMVSAVLNRSLGNIQDAEDGFQATFLILARKAHSLRQQSSLGVFCTASP